MIGCDVTGPGRCELGGAEMGWPEIGDGTDIGGRPEIGDDTETGGRTEAGGCAAIDLDDGDRGGSSTMPPWISARPSVPRKFAHRGPRSGQGSADV
jgi:hypothetical protein